MKPIYLSIGLLLLCAGHVCAQDNFVDGVELATASAPWRMRILGSDLDIAEVKVRQDDRAVYFMMTSGSTKLNVSVYIEPVDACKSSEECRDYTLNQGNPAWGKYEQLSKGNLKNFSYFEFYRPEAEGQPLKMLDMYAEHVSQGYWIDLHISKVLYQKEDHALFEKVVNSVELLPQTGGAKTAFDAQSATGQAAVTSWLALWEKGKCKESYAALAPLSRAGITEQDWSNYCIGQNKDLGANKTRKLIGAAFAKSRSDRTDRPLAVLAYRGTFTNEPVVVELISLILEKNGTWTVTNYLPK